MQSKAATVTEYLARLPADRRKAIEAVRRVIQKNLPKRYKEAMQYGMIGYSVPLQMYPAGYLGDKKTPLPYAGLASQKNHMAVYLMNVYGNKENEQWFGEELEDWEKERGKKVNMGKSCVRFKKLEDLPVELIAKAIAKTPVNKFIVMYEESRKR